MADVTCARCGETRPSAGRVLPGAVGDEIEARVCAQCWTEWLAQQIRVINHYGLRPALREDREKLYDFTREFLGLTARAEDPIPPAP
jgi:Fe-S cluster biosynthesis and repair protein YggX